MENKVQIQKFTEIIGKQLTNYINYLAPLQKLFAGKEQWVEIKQIMADIKGYIAAQTSSMSLKVLVDNYQQFINKIYVAINNLFRHPSDDLTKFLYELEEMYTNSVATIHAAHNILYVPKKHHFLVAACETIQNIFEKSHAKNALNQFNALFKQRLYSNLVHYLDSEFIELDLNAVLNNDNDVYEVMSLVNTIVNYWNLYNDISFGLPSDDEAILNEA